MQTCKLKKKRTGFAYTYGNLGIKTGGTWHIYSVHEPILMHYKERVSEEALGNETQTQLEPDTLHFLLKAVCNLKLISESERMMRMNYMWVSPVSLGRWTSQQQKPCIQNRQRHVRTIQHATSLHWPFAHIQHMCSRKGHINNNKELLRSVW